MMIILVIVSTIKVCNHNNNLFVGNRTIFVLTKADLAESSGLKQQRVSHLHLFNKDTLK